MGKKATAEAVIVDLDEARLKLWDGLCRDVRWQPGLLLGQWWPISRRPSPACAFCDCWAVRMSRYATWNR